ncbi:CsbD family protein [Nodularia harveyana UHCC-0300]|uniref:CsbD family protein n=1 Tax=Nodularia harveyana UHCC-0300 TaxID=2974287 RepID=A0ABU5UC43_9CYAN|nr:CsbD family protein [Nodularia harveyana]MEA5581097.1 CsbD family protein [Nodularia harveyana UHCC-0300]
MSIEKRVEATAKNIEGKVQEAVAEITGNPEDKTTGQAKQVEAEVIHTKENIKDQVKEVIE